MLPHLGLAAPPLASSGNGAALLASPLASSAVAGSPLDVSPLVIAPVFLLLLAAPKHLDLPPHASFTLSACALALLVPGGAAFAASLPLLSWRLLAATQDADQPDAPAGRSMLPPLGSAVAAAVGAGAIVAAESAAGLDTGSQFAALVGFGISLGLVTSLPVETAHEEQHRPSDGKGRGKRGGGRRPEEDDAMREARKEALSLRRSWDARLSWRLRKGVQRSVAADSDVHAGM